ncbi:MAG: hypothetical protein AAF850_12470 [Pseudomonadota bacterium]
MTSRRETTIEPLRSPGENQVRVKLNQILRGRHVNKPIEGVRLEAKVVGPPVEDVPERVAALLSNRTVYFLRDKDDYARVLTEDEAGEAKALMRKLKSLQAAS